MIFRFTKFIIFTALLLTFFSCGKTKDEEVADTVRTAINFLNTKQCQQAMDLLQAMGMQYNNASYLKALASSYACRAGYSTTKFFGSDISLTANPAPLGGMTKYSTSLVTVTSPLTSDSSFSDLREAIRILQYAGGVGLTVEPTASARAPYFTTRDAGDINSMLAYMLLVQAGKLMKVYADTDANGIKGGGTGSNTCFTDYTTTDAAIQAYLLTGNTGVCITANSSHPELAIGVSDRKMRLCEGVTLFNAILDILPSVILSAGGGDLDDISGVTDDIEAVKETLIEKLPAIGTTATVISPYNCLTDTTITEVTLSSYYAVVFEGLVK